MFFQFTSIPIMARFSLSNINLISILIFAISVSLEDLNQLLKIIKSNYLIKPFQISSVISSNNSSKFSLNSYNCSSDYLKCLKLLMKMQSQSEVKLCSDGQYFNSLRGECVDCSQCPPNSRTERQCNSTHDTKCVCGSALYWNQNDFDCKPCSQCEPGWGESPLCDI